MKRWIVGGSAVLLLASGLITSPPASASSLYGRPFISKCDGPVQSDGTWQRCTAVAQYVPSGFSFHLVPVKRCDLMGPGQPAWDQAFGDPAAHID